MHTVIGVTPSYSYDKNSISLNYDYIKAIEKAGGTAVILGYQPEQKTLEALSFLNGILFSGGGDINPLVFHEEPLFESGEINPFRDDYELALCKEALFVNMPILAICRGIQVLCAADGGTIYQDIKSPLKHMQQAPRFHPTHTIEIRPNTLLYEIAQTKTITVNSFHHQAVKYPGEHFLSSAWAKDGIIEAIEHKNNTFAVGVQWHPEAMAKKDTIQSALFQRFVLESAKFHLK